jgi:N-ethylmaleimide reductase
MINSNFDQETGNKIIEDGDDLVAYGKPYISNPDLVERFENNLELAVWDQDTFYTTVLKAIMIIQLPQIKLLLIKQ